MDAHTDLRESYEGEPLSHSTPIRKVCDLIGPKTYILSEFVLE